MRLCFSDKNILAYPHSLVLGRVYINIFPRPPLLSASGAEPTRNLKYIIIVAAIAVTGIYSMTGNFVALQISSDYESL